MRARLKLMMGVALVLAGVILMTISITPKPVPPVTFLWNQSGFVNENGVYFDSIAIHNYGSSNVTVVVVIEDLIDTHPRVSDPITLCPNCTATVQIEATQPPPQPKLRSTLTVHQTAQQPRILQRGVSFDCTAT